MSIDWLKHDLLLLTDEFFPEFKEEATEKAIELESRYEEYIQKETTEETLNEGEEINSEISSLSEEIKEVKIRSDIEEIRKKSEYWADEFMERYEKAKEELTEEEKEYKENTEEGKSWKNLYPSPASQKKSKVKVGVGMAKAGLTPDSMTEVMTDIEAAEMIGGAKFYSDQEKLKKELDNMTYEDAMELNEELYKDEEINQKTYYYLKSYIRNYYRV